MLHLLFLTLTTLQLVEAQGKLCGTYGNNWSAEIRCLRALLSQCQGGRSGSGRDTRSNPVFPRQDYRPMYQPVYKPEGNHHFERVEPWRFYTTAAPTTTVAPIDVCSDCEEKVKASLIDDLDSKYTKLEADFDERMRALEQRLDSAGQGNNFELEKELRGLKKKLELLTSRLHHRGNKEYAYMERKESWYDASEQCHLWGGRLAKPNNKDENVYLAKLLPSGTNAWIAINDIQNEAHFVDDKNGASNYTRWSKGQPDNGNHNENCVLIHSNSEWTDEFCMIARDFLCER
ncbi:unnamed protein product, partial [Mesorhabditis spiculigera]